MIEPGGEIVEHPDQERAVAPSAPVLMDQGLSWSEPTADEVTRWRGLAREASAQIVGREVISPALYETLQEQLAEYRGTLD